MRKSRGVRVEVQYGTSRRGVPRALTLRCWAQHALESRSAAVCIRVVGRAESRELNRRWRGKNKPTNVLSFAYENNAKSGSITGDLAICAPIVASEAREQDKTPSAHWAHMVVHGVLHLMGYDHVKNRDAKKMTAREVEILSYFGYQDPYVGR